MEQGFIRKRKVEHGVTIVKNESLRDEELSFGARGLLGMLLTLPEDWEIKKSDLHKRSLKDGRDKTINYFNELIEKNYVFSNEVRDNGQFSRIDYIVSDVPFTENPFTDIPFTDFQGLYKVKSNKVKKEEVNNNLLHKLQKTEEKQTFVEVEEKTKKETPPPIAVAPPIDDILDIPLFKDEETLFDKWWTIYKKKVGKIPCQKLFLILFKKKNMEECRLMIEHTKEYMKLYDDSNSHYIVKPLEYLKNKHWNEPDFISSRDFSKRKTIQGTAIKANIVADNGWS